MHHSQVIRRSLALCILHPTPPRDDHNAHNSSTLPVPNIHILFGMSTDNTRRSRFLRLESHPGATSSATTGWQGIVAIGSENIPGMKSLRVVQVVIVGFDSGWLHEIRKLNGPSNYFRTDTWYKLKPCSQSPRRNKHLVNLVFHAIALLINCHESSPPRNQATLGKAQVYSSLIITKLPMLQLFVEWPNFCQWQANKLEMKGCAHIMLHLHTTFMFQWLRYTPNICTTCHGVGRIDSIALSWTWQQAPSSGIIIVMTFKRFYERKTDQASRIFDIYTAHRSFLDLKNTLNFNSFVPIHPEY